MNTSRTRRGLSLIEMLAVVAVVGILSVLLIPRVSEHSSRGKTVACDLNRGEIELQVQLWRRASGSFPAANLSDIGALTSYFPDGLPVCPVDGSAYTIDTATGRVLGHSH
ncbi:hypothetical protein Pla123a_46920 [Posidoniimonas polymericola]|uniref:Type II secretion system protein G n=1 Tax=Posidoniimonas polymericola TaxID=2528002 RepID=A0A5C5XU98_9BACT|nr:type II secretion system protein [Posidoniimonas polymericola]TWT66298.1 hypothetical protein Pla123a_46920 [Posidoniimonas polymericola]